MRYKITFLLLVLCFVTGTALASVAVPGSGSPGGEGSNAITWQLSDAERQAYLNSVADYLTSGETAQILDVFILIGFYEHRIDVSGYDVSCENLVVFKEGSDNTKSLWPNTRCEGDTLIITSGGTGHYFIATSEDVFSDDPSVNPSNGSNEPINTNETL